MDEENNNNNEMNPMYKIGASIAGAVGISLIGYIIWDYFSKRNKNKKNENEENVKENSNKTKSKPINKNKNNNNKETPLNQQEEQELTEMQFMEAKMDTLVQGETEFPKSLWKEEEFANWKDSRNKIYKRCFCGKNAETEKLQNCGKCKGIFYCGRGHQIESWTVRGHKEFCSKLASSNNITFSAFKKLLIENSPPINRSEFATEDSLNLVLKRLFDNKFEDEIEEAVLLKEVGRLTWMLAQIKYNNKPNNTEFNNMMDLSFNYLQNAWSKKDALSHDLELKAQTQWLLGEHYMSKSISKGSYFLYHSVMDMLTFHSKLMDRLKIEETKKLLQIWIAALIERLMQGDFIEQASEVLSKTLQQAESRQDIEWQLQTIDLQCLLSAYRKSKEKNIIVELAPTSSFTKDMHRFYEEIKKENKHYADLERQLQNNPNPGYGYGNQQFSPEEFEKIMKSMIK